MPAKPAWVFMNPALVTNTKLNFILGQCSQAEIQARFMCGWLLVNTDRTDYKVTSV